MTNDIFYSILKLVTGEEILAKVCAFIENDEVMIVLDNPIIVDIILSNKTKVPFVKVLPWINLTNENLHIIRRKDVVTMTEVKDKNIVAIHKRYVNEMSEERYYTQSSFTSKPKNILKVDEARSLFERLYRSQESSTTSD